MMQTKKEEDGNRGSIRKYIERWESGWLEKETYSKKQM